MEKQNSIPKIFVWLPAVVFSLSILGWLLRQNGKVQVNYWRLELVEKRLDKKIKIINENRDDIDELRNRIIELETKIKCKP